MNKQKQMVVGRYYIVDSDGLFYAALGGWLSSPDHALNFSGSVDAEKTVERMPDFMKRVHSPKVVTHKAEDVIQDAEEEWYDDHGNVCLFAHVLVASALLEEAEDTIYYFEKPWKWTPERDRWLLAGRPETVPPDEDGRRTRSRKGSR